MLTAVSIASSEDGCRTKRFTRTSIIQRKVLLKNNSMKKDYDFPVTTTPVWTRRKGTMIRIPDRVAVLREDTLIPLGVVSKKYAIVEHTKVIDGFREAFGDEKLNERIQLTHNGARLHYEVTLPNVLVDVGGGDKIALRLIVQNSYDGSHRLQVIFGAFRLVCKNGLIIGRKFLSVSRKHLGQVSMELDVEKIRKQIEYTTAMFTKTGEEMKKMREVTVPLRVLESTAYDAKSLQIPAYLVEEAQNEFMRSEGTTVWDYYNSLTFAITHKMTKENPEAQIFLGQKAWNASVALTK